MPISARRSRALRLGHGVDVVGQCLGARTIACLPVLSALYLLARLLRALDVFTDEQFTVSAQTDPWLGIAISCVMILLARSMMWNVVPPMYAVAMTIWLALRRRVGWLKGKAAAGLSWLQLGFPGHHSQPADPAVQQHIEAQLISIMPMLLIHLAPAERRTLWQVSKQLALEVWRCSPAAKLSVCNALGMRRWTTQLLPSSCAARSTPLAQLIQSKRPGFLPAAAFLPRIQSLSLSSMQLDASSFESLQALLPNLRHLALEACRIKAETRARPAAAGGVPDAPTGAKGQGLISLCSFRGWQSTAAAFVDSRRLQSLGTPDQQIFSQLQSHQFPALRVLRLTSGVVCDDQLDMLLGAKPQMQEVWLPQLELRRDHSAQACSWGLLRLQGNPMGENAPDPKYTGLHALELALLPLEGIRRLVIERELYAWSEGNAADLQHHGCTWSSAWPRLREAAERLEFEPGITGWGHLWAWSTRCMSQVDLGLEDDEPGFTLHLSGPRLRCLRVPPEVKGLAEVVARRLQGGTLVYSGCDESWPLQTVQPLHSLSSAVQSVVLRGCEACWCMAESAALMFELLPLHVERLVVLELKSDLGIDSYMLPLKRVRTEFSRQQCSRAAQQLTTGPAAAKL